MGRARIGVHRVCKNQGVQGSGCMGCARIGGVGWCRDQGACGVQGLGCVRIRVLGLAKMGVQGVPLPCPLPATACPSLAASLSPCPSHPLLPYSRPPPPPILGSAGSVTPSPPPAPTLPLLPSTPLTCRGPGRHFWGPPLTPLPCSLRLHQPLPAPRAPCHPHPLRGPGPNPPGIPR